MAHNLINKIARSVLPPSYHPEVYLARLVRERTGMVVAGGCFAGFIFPRESARVSLVPMLLGTFERPLAVVVEEIVQRGFDTIVNAGAAEGYYAVGLARRVPHAIVHAFEMDEGGRSLLAETAAANGVADRVRIHGRCEPADLRRCLAAGQHDLVICDVEGYESVLLDPDLIPQLTSAHVLVELHELIHPGIAELLRARFEGSHRIEEIWDEPRSARDYPFRTFYTRLLPERFLLNSITEPRSERQSWFWMRPR